MTLLYKETFTTFVFILFVLFDVPVKTLLIQRSSDQLNEIFHKRESRMYTVRLPTVHVVATTRCQRGWIPITSPKTYLPPLVHVQGVATHPEPYPPPWTYLPLEGTWDQRYPPPGKDMGPEIPYPSFVTALQHRWRAVNIVCKLTIGQTLQLLFPKHCFLNHV